MVVLVFLSGDKRERKCRVCRVPGHTSARCPIKADDNVRCGCKDRTCGKCAALCAVCDKAGHKPDNVEEVITGRCAPRWSCASHDTDAMAVRLRKAHDRLPLTVRAQKEAARGHKRALAAIRPSAGNRFRSHVAQSEFIDLTGLGGAAASAAVRVAAGVRAVVEDADISRPAARALGAFASDVGSRAGMASAQPIPGALGDVALSKRRATVVEALEKAFAEAPADSPGRRASQRARNREFGLGRGGAGAADEVLGSANQYFGLEGKELKRAVQRYVSLPDGREQGLVKLTMARFVGEGRVFTGASVTCSELTCEAVCGELMECAAHVGLTVPAVLASLRQFIVEMRRGKDDLRRILDDAHGRPGATEGSPSSERE